MTFIKTPDGLVHIVDWLAEGSVLGQTWCEIMYTENSSLLNIYEKKSLVTTTHLPPACLACIAKSAWNAQT